MIDSVAGLVEGHVDLGGSQFSESILERWYFARALQQNVVALEFGSPCPPRSPSLVHDSRHDQQRIFPILLRSTSSSTLNVSLSWAERTRELSRTSAVLRVATGRPVLSWVCSTLRLMLSSDERVWIISVSTGHPVLSEELSSSQKELTSISWERDVFLPSCNSCRHDLSRNWIWS